VPDDGGVEVTYPEVGETRDGRLPAGYHHARYRRAVGHGRRDFAAAVAGLRDWGMFRAAGMRIRTHAPHIAPGVEFGNGLGVGRVRLWAPCQVVWVSDEPDRYAFGIGTLPGHPESGEEAFDVVLTPEGRVLFEVRAFSRPVRWYSRLGGPVTRALQHWVYGRYLRGLRTVVRTAAG
jgi:uncharacterized protein (UPF0548 family)